MLDGYLTAVIIGPCSILPNEWFVDLLGDRGRIATAAGKTLAAMTAIAARFNAVSDSLATAPKRHAPMFEKTDDGLALPQPCGRIMARERWWKLMDTDIGIIPLPIYLVLLGVVVTFTLTGTLVHGSPPRWLR